MPQVNFTSALKRFYPKLDTITAESTTVADILQEVEQEFPGLKDYIVDERGRLRKHVNIYIGEDLIKDRENLSDEVSEDAKILIFQALSGG